MLNRGLAVRFGFPDTPEQPRYEQLAVLEGRQAWLSPWLATVLSGSVPVHMSWGLTRWHALGRAARWARGRADHVFVSGWGGDSD
ncbi:hypothetical protein [Nocardia altamirensis]|uniref:hypothetical protein n=1 Tax=Nocardia altamirensis TaxID=472158 RepID=UPI00114C8EA6|nr:hypothetical protein [Nocardia altamirensis]